MKSIQERLSYIKPESWKAIHEAAVLHRKANPKEWQRVFNPFIAWLHDNYVASLENELRKSKDCD